MRADNRLGAEVRRLRLAQTPHMRQKDLAARIGHSSPSQINRIENGDVAPSEETLTEIAKALGVKPRHFAAFGGPYDPTAPRQTQRQRAIARQSLQAAGETFRVSTSQETAEVRSTFAARASEADQMLLEHVIDLLAALPRAERNHWLTDLAARAKRVEDQGKGKTEAPGKSTAGGGQ